MCLRTMREVKRSNGGQRARKQSSQVMEGGLEKALLSEVGPATCTASQRSNGWAARTLVRGTHGSCRGSSMQLLTKYLLTRHYVPSSCLDSGDRIEEARLPIAILYRLS